MYTICIQDSQANGRSIPGTTTPPTEPGSYVMTVVTLGGDYQAAPITRGFNN